MLVALAALLVSLPLAVEAQSGVLATRAADGKIRFQAIEELQIEGSHRVRVLPLNVRSITPDEARKLVRLELTQVGTLRADAQHRLVRLDETGKAVELILPDAFAPKVPVDSSIAQGQLKIEAIQSRKTKTGDLIAQNEFYLFTAGAEPDRLALQFVTWPAAFPNLQEQLAAMESFAASFPASPLKAELRDNLESRLSAGLSAFENRGTIDDLLLTSQFGALARRAFPGDAPLAQLANAITAGIESVNKTQARLHSLAAAGEWDPFLNAYEPFERYQWSFPELMALRQQALQESARVHAQRGRQLSDRHQYKEAAQEFALAGERDPENQDLARLIESQRVLGSQLEAGGARPRTLPSGSPEDLRFKRDLQYADNAIRDKDFAKARQSLQDARSENKDAPELLLTEAKLLAALDRLSEALPLLDQYDHVVSGAKEREAADSIRTNILYDLEKKRAEWIGQLRQTFKDGNYTRLRDLAAHALELDGTDPEFLYLGGIASAVLRDNGVAKERLEKYLARSNSLTASPEERDRARRVLAALTPAPPLPATGTPNWLSGRPVAEGVFYCPISGAFQPAIDSIAGYKMRMNFQREDRLLSMTTTFEDEKGSQNYHALNNSSDGRGAFFFSYGPRGTQVQVASASPIPPSAAPPPVLLVHDGRVPPHLVDEHGLTRIVLQDHSQFNVGVLSLLEGPVATGIAGNSYFNPFIWDGLHYFALRYDPQGKLATAEEWNVDNIVHFTWSGDRLTQIRAFHRNGATPYYVRTLTYSGAALIGESYSWGGKTGQVKYVYAGRVLQQIRVEDGGVHDGKTWTVRIRP